MPTLTTVDDLKRFLDIPASDTSEDTRLSELLDGVEAAVESFTGRRFASQAYTEYHDGAGRELLVLHNRPVTAIASVKVDATGYSGHGTGAFADATDTWVIGTDFVPRSLAADEDNPGLLNAIESVWPTGLGNVQVIYTAGYTMAPSDVVLAIHQIAAGVRSGSEKGGTLGGESIAKYSYTLMSGGAAKGGAVADARATLSRYREVPL